MAYAQTNYQEKVGNGPYTIAEIGCFVTAFCNLLQEDFGINEAPDALNAAFIAHNSYLADPADGAGVKDDLTWDSITQLYPQVVSEGTGGSGWPATSRAIVKFYYKSERTGAMTTHFCKVADPVAKTIVDSWDGVTKTTGEYGEPVAWAVYGPAVVQPVVTAVNAPAPAAPATEVLGSVNVAGLSLSAAMKADLAGGMTVVAFNAKYSKTAGFEPISTSRQLATPAAAPVAPAPTATPAPTNTPEVEPDTTSIKEQVTITADTLNVRLAPNTTSEAKEANTSDGSLHQGNIIEVTGWVHGENVNGNDIWLRSVRNNWLWSGGTNFDLSQTKTPDVTPATTSTTVVTGNTTAQTVTLSTTPPVVKPQMVNNIPGAGGESVPVKVNTPASTPLKGWFKTIEDLTVTDFSGKGDPITVPKGTPVEAAETFSENGVKYVRSQSSVEKGTKYGFPATSLKPTQAPEALTAGNLISDVKNNTEVHEIDDDIDSALDDLYGPNGQVSHARETLIADVGKAEGFVGKIFKKK